MFEQTAEKTIGQYNFDPLQLSLVVLKDKGATVRIQYFSGHGETNIDLPLSSTTIEGVESSLQNALDGKAPIKLKFKTRNTYILHLSHFNNTKSEYSGGGLAMLLARFLPVSSVRCHAQHVSAQRFLLDLKEAMYNPALKRDALKRAP
jgi:hypothetical protein